MLYFKWGSVIIISYSYRAYIYYWKVLAAFALKLCLQHFFSQKNNFCGKHINTKALLLICTKFKRIFWCDFYTFSSYSVLFLKTLLSSFLNNNILNIMLIYIRKYTKEDYKQQFKKNVTFTDIKYHRISLQTTAIIKVSQI